MDVAPNVTASGAYTTGFHWTGGENMTTVGTDDLNCKNWKSALATDTSAMGYDSSSFSGFFFGNWTSRSQCNSYNHLLCLQAP